MYHPDFRRYDALELDRILCANLTRSKPQLKSALESIKQINATGVSLKTLKSPEFVVNKLIITGLVSEDEIDKRAEWLIAGLAREATPPIRAKLRELIERELSKLEIAKESSVVNGMFFPVWDDSALTTVSKAGKFVDNDFNPHLSPAQIEQLVCWRRISELSQGSACITTAMKSKGTCRVIQSHWISNCSLVSSLSIMMQRSGRKDKTLAINNLFPQNRFGQAVYNPQGKYTVKLFWNGSFRSVTIDDFIPCGEQRKPLCAQTSDGSWWASLVEKAYLKLVSGGYDFWAGSHSGIDIYALTGWPPETLSIDENESEQRDSLSNRVSERVWTRLLAGMSHQDNIITASSRPDVNEEKTGICRSHAYAILGAEDRETGRTLLLRNPWSDNPSGEFWVEVKAFPKLFKSINVNWNLALFQHVSHHNCRINPQTSDSYCGESTQFSLHVSPGTKYIWIVVSRHVNAIADLENPSKAVACIAMRSEGQRVLHIQEELIINAGPYHSGPHSLCRIEEPEETTMTLVLNSLEQQKAIHATVSCFSTSQATVVKELAAPGQQAFSFQHTSCSTARDYWVIKYGLGTQPWTDLHITLNTDSAEFALVDLCFWVIDVRAKLKLKLHTQLVRSSVTSGQLFHSFQVRIPRDPFGTARISTVRGILELQACDVEYSLLFEAQQGFVQGVTQPEGGPQQTTVESLLKEFPLHV